VTGVILWDFDGTLAYRPGMWRGCLIEVLDEHAAGHGVDADQLRPFLRDGFPWHRPEVAHPELCQPDAWWRQIEVLLAGAYEGVGIGSDEARELAGRVRGRFVDASRGWRLFDDTLPALGRLRSEGWRHVVLSNHVPELPALADGLGLSPLIDEVHTSAVTGYEKPNRRAFELALESCGRPNEVWMVGDNPVADVAGAEAVGIPAILVRSEASGVPRHAPDLHEAASIILTQSGRGALDRTLSE
jgi:putative hydrolase of the HAD superfamily